MALSAKTFDYAGGAVTDIFGGLAKQAALKLKSEGSLVEAQNYDLAGDLAHQNELFTEQSTSVKQVAADRAIYMNKGSLEANIAQGGFANSGSALDILRSSATQGAQQHQMIGQQGLITEEGYNEQEKSFRNLANYSRMASEAESKAGDMAGIMGYVGGGFKAAAAMASVFSGGA